MYQGIRINPGDYDQPHADNIRGVDVQVFLSPYDIPEEVSGYFDASISRFVIELCYIGGEEPLVTIPEDQFITAKVGRHSRRLYRIELDMDGMKAQKIELNLEKLEMAKKAIDRLSSLEKKPRRGNYKTVKQVITDKASEIFAS